MKRLLMLFSAVLMVLCAVPVTARAAQSTTLTVTADKAVANPGDKVNFTVTLGAVNNLGGIDFKLKIPEGLSLDYDSVTLPEGLGALLDSDGEIIKPTQINENFFSYSAQKTGYTGSQELVILKFACTVDSDSALGKKKVEIEGQDVYDNTVDLTAINTAVKAAELSVEKAAAPTQSTTLTVTADKAVANPGDKVNFTVSLGAVNNLGGIDFKLKIPAGLSLDYDSVTLPDGLGALLDSDGDIIKPTQINENLFSYSAQKTGYTGSQELVILKFTCTVDSDSALEKKTVGIEGQDVYENTTELTTINTAVKAAELSIEKAAAPTQSTTLAVTADKAVANPGDKVNFTVSLGAVNNLGGIDFKLKIPAGLSLDYDSVTLPDGLGALLDSDGDIIKPTQINENLFSYSAQKTGYTGSQELVILKFTCTVDSDSALEKKTVGIEGQDVYENTTELTTINTAVKAAELTVEKKAVPAGCEHSLTKVDAVAAACEADGNVAYYSCGKCEKKFADAEGKKELTDVTVKATGHTAGAWKPAEDKHTQACNICGKTLKEEAHVYDNDADSACNICGYQRFYQIISGADVPYEKESGKDLEIKADGDYTLFEAVKVDGEVVSPENYSVVEGSTIVTLKTSYLETLSAGVHKIDITYTDGKVATTQIKIQEKSGGTTEKPGDTTEKPGDTTEEPDDSSEEPDDTPQSSDSAEENIDVKPVKSPNTGENSRTGLGVGLAAAVLAGMAGVFVYRKNRRNGQDR